MNSQSVPALSAAENELNLLMRQGRFRKIVEQYNSLPKPIRRQPGPTNTYACALIVTGEFRKAAQALGNIPFRERTADIWNNLAVTSIQLGRTEEALALVDRALNRFPNSQTLLLTQARCLTALERFEEAYRSALDAVAVAKDEVSLLAAGKAVENLDRAGEAITFYQAVLKSIPQDDAAAENHKNIYQALFAAGRSSEKLGRFDEAIEYYRGALELFPDDGAAANNLNLLYMQTHRFSEAWDLAEIRMRSPANRHLFRKYFSAECAAWDGAPLDGRRLHVIGDQGVGDQIMFSQFLQKLGRFRPEKVVAYIDTRLVGFFERWFDSDIDIAFTTFPAAPTFGERDLKVALSSLPNYAARGESDFSRKPFIRGIPVGRKFSEALGRPAFGLSWWSSGLAGAERSLDLAELAAALLSQNAAYLSMQYNPAGAETDRLKALMGDRLVVLEELDCTDDFIGMAETAVRLDGVISIPNTTVHITGAIGVPTGVLLPDEPSWRYISMDDRMIWYGDHVRLYAVRQRGDLQGRIGSFVRGIAG